MAGRREMIYGRFTWMGGWQYFKTYRGKRSKNGQARLYKQTEDRTFIKGEEEVAWQKILDKFPSNQKKEYVMRDKSIKELHSMGYSMANRDGSVYTG